MLVRLLVLAGALALASCGGGDPEVDRGEALATAPAGPPAALLAPTPTATGDAPAAPRAQRADKPLRTQTFGEASLTFEALAHWAEATFPAYFSGGADTGTYQQYTYRFYPQSGNYMAISQGALYLMGPLTQGQITHVGQLTDFTCRVLACPSAPAVTNVRCNDPVVNRPSGFECVVTGLNLLDTTQPGAPTSTIRFEARHVDGSGTPCLTATPAPPLDNRTRVVFRCTITSGAMIEAAVFDLANNRLGPGAFAFPSQP